MISATYCPHDNKIRLNPGAERLPAEVYDRVKAAGFTWAPGQKIFIGQMWTPQRFDLALELAGSVDDEDSTPEERAAVRAERFGERASTQADLALRMADAMGEVSSVIGASNRGKAEKMKDKAEAAMQRAVDMWETSEYWAYRAKAALRHLKFKEDPGVRHRRIKGLKSDLRKQEKGIEEATTRLSFWDLVKPITQAHALRVANLPGSSGLWSDLHAERITPEDAMTKAKAAGAASIAWHTRWADHYRFRIEFEMAMLGEAGGIAADQFNIEVGGRVLVDSEWVTVVRVNKKGGEVVSVTTNARYVAVRGIEEVKGYEPPTAKEFVAVKAATKLAPLANYDGEGFTRMTKAEWDRIYKDSKWTVNVGVGAANRYERSFSAPVKAGHGVHRQRVLSQGGRALVPVFLTDSKVVEPPAPPKVESTPAPDISAPVRDIEHLPSQASRQAAQPNKFDAMRETLRTGLTVAVSDQLFPTPMALARRMVELAGVFDGARVLEPSAGTGNLIKAVLETAKSCAIVAIEESPDLARALAKIETGPGVHVEAICKDFLEPLAIGTFDIVLMNPPFRNGADVVHIKHAMKFLKPGGQLVAICAGGPRQETALKGLCDTWERLPAGTFKEAGTDVNTVLLTITADEEITA